MNYFKMKKKSEIEFYFVVLQYGANNIKTTYVIFLCFLTVHHSMDLFHLPTLTHNTFIH